MNPSSKRVLAISTLILLGALSRLLPHPPNFTPIAALALFGGSQLSDKKFLSFLVPLAAMFISDAAIGFHALMPIIYLSFCLIVILGKAIETMRPLKLFTTSFIGSCIFFLLSNFGVWLQSGMYPLTWSGLVACYVAAIPFFGNFFLGTFVYGTFLFGSFAGLERLLPNIGKKAELAKIGVW